MKYKDFIQKIGIVVEESKLLLRVSGDISLFTVNFSTNLQLIASNGFYNFMENVNGGYCRLIHYRMV